MKSILGTSAAKKTMRVATAFTGVAATAFTGVATFAPAAKANSQVYYPYVLWVKTSSLVTSIQVCGYKDVGTGEWYCTEPEANPYHYLGTHSNYFGGNWKDGKVNVYDWWHSTEYHAWIKSSHTCNTNGAYHGVLRLSVNGNSGVSLSAGSHYALGMSKKEC
jgi:hypothetical protein